MSYITGKWYRICIAAAIASAKNGARLSCMECHFTPEYSREFTFVGIKDARDSAAIAIAAYESEESGLPVEIPLSKAMDGEQK